MNLLPGLQIRATEETEAAIRGGWGSEGTGIRAGVEATLETIVTRALVPAAPVI